MIETRNKKVLKRPNRFGLIGVLGVLISLVVIRAQEFRITDITVSADGRPRLKYPADTNFYYILYRGSQVTNIALATDIQLGLPDTGELTDSANPASTSFYRIHKISLSQSLDSDGDGVKDAQELRSGHNPLDPADGAAQRLTTITSSPANGEAKVSVTRETIIYFSNPLSETTRITTNQLYATFSGRRILSRPELSVDRRKVTLFYLEPTGNRANLPGNTRVRVTFDGDNVRDSFGHLVDADGDGTPGGVATIDFDTLSQTLFSGTTVCGRVFASELSVRSDGLTDLSVNVPLPGVIITADGLEDLVRATTDALGDFRLTNAPAGEFFVHIDGRAVTNVAAGIRFPDLAYYPVVGKLWASIAGGETNIGEVYLPLVADDTLQTVSATQPTTISFPAQVLNDHPELNGVSLTVPPNALFSDNGSRGGKVGIAPVPANRLPGPLPPGLSFPLVITVQTDGAQNFSQPVPACFPNLPSPETGQTLPPGAKSSLWSFNHDTGRFEFVGSMTVSADGTLVCTDPGVGIPAPGWHGVCQCVTCATGDCVNSDPNPDPNPPPPKYPPGINGHPPQCGADEGGPTDPVHLFSGEFFDTVEDLRIQGVGLDFVWRRTYRSYGAGGRTGRLENGLAASGASSAAEASAPQAQGDSQTSSRNGRIGRHAGAAAAAPPPSPLGLGWDHSYNIYLDIYVRQDLPLKDATAIGLHDGTGRLDLYHNRSDGTWSVLGFFRQFTANADGTLTLTFEDQTRWNFEVYGPFREHGRIRTIVDRYDNAMLFDYDAEGLLTKITDTLGRNILLSYDHSFDKSEGGPRLTSVKDFAGRVLRYDYFTPPYAEFGGLLKSATLPAVLGTPNGNDFPAGKTTRYTYTPEEQKLATITDARGNKILENIYSPSTNPRDPDWGAVIRQLWGGNIVDIVYVKQSPAAENNNAVIRTIVNDRNGNVKEYFYDAGNRCTAAREYTGRANPAQPTTETLNRPVNKLRADDPDFFETRYEYNLDYKRTRTIHPNGDITQNIYEADLNPAAPARFRGNLREVHHLPGSHTPAGDQAELVEKFEYATDFAGCCGFNFVTRYTDARGNVELFQYDDRGNLIAHTNKIDSIVERWKQNERGQVIKHILPDNGSGVRRVDTKSYYATGPQTGYLQTEVLDADHFKLTTTFEYDAVGNVIRRIDPRGHDTQFVVNQLNQVVRELSPEVTDGSGVRYGKDYFYDANNNLVRVDVQNLNEEGVLDPLNPVLTTRYEYEILNQLIRTTAEVEENHYAVTEYAYDGNRNRTLTRYGEATAGRQPDNVVQTLYDERDLAFQEIRAPGSPNQSTTQFDYDGNKNRVRNWQGLEDAPRLTTYTFDAFNRLVSMLDPMGNVGTNKYDPAGNRTNSVFLGELIDVPGSADNIRLSETSFAYDALNRITNEAAAFFNTTNQAPIGDGLATTVTIYSDLSQVVAVINDNGHGKTNRYDTANRLQVRIDAKGNTVSYDYDGNSNVRQMTENEKPDLGGPDEVFFTTYGCDNLNRLTSTADNVGNVNRTGYDSRDNRTVTIDALTNKVFYAFDGLNRLLRTTRLMTDSGVGSGTVMGQIVTRQTWDDSSRLTSQIDDNGNATTYVHDGLDRKTATLFADGTGQTNVFDPHHDAVRFTDANGNIVTSAYDAGDRLVRKDIVCGPGVATNTTFEVFQYDGLGQLVHAEDNGSLVTRRYDSLSHMTAEVQNGQTVASIYDGVGSRTQCTYASGRVITENFDELERTKTISDTSGVIATYAYVGPGRVARRDYGNGTRAAYTYDGVTGITNSAGDFGVRQITRTKHTKISDGSVLDDRSYTWDRLGNKTGRRDLRPGGTTHDYGYDSIYRLRHSVAAPTTGPPQTIGYTLDGAGNRLAVTGGRDAGTYTLSAALPEPADFQLNQYTTTPFDSRSSDREGNLIRINASLPTERVLAFDYRNRLVGFTNQAAGVAAIYGYDPLGRRISKTVNDGTTKTLRFLYDGLRICDEKNQGGVEIASYVYGLYIDEVLTMRRGVQTSFYHSDDLYNISALSDLAGAVTERTEYGDFGKPSFFNPSGDSISRSALFNPWLFTGRSFDSETSFYEYRSRYFDFRNGRFTSRDAIGLWGDIVNTGNGQTYVGINPWSWIDPFGLLTKSQCDTIRKMLGNEKQWGTSLTAFKFSNTTWGKWFGTKMGEEFNNQPIPTDYSPTPIDLDWWTDLQSVALTYEAGRALAGNVGRDQQMVATYIEAKLIWKMANEVGLLFGKGERKGWPFQDYKEREALKAIIGDRNHYSDLFPPGFMKTHCPMECSAQSTTRTTSTPPSFLWGY